MSEGIKETKELLMAVNDLSLVLIKQFKDGIQAKDALELYAAIGENEALKSELFAAYSGISKVPAEVKDLDLQESLELASVQIGFVPKIVEAFKAA